MARSLTSRHLAGRSPICANWLLARCSGRREMTSETRRRRRRDRRPTDDDEEDILRNIVEKWMRCHARNNRAARLRPQGASSLSFAAQTRARTGPERARCCCCCCSRPPSLHCDNSTQLNAPPVAQPLNSTGWLKKTRLDSPAQFSDCRLKRPPKSRSASGKLAINTRAWRPRDSLAGCAVGQLHWAGAVFTAHAQCMCPNDNDQAGQFCIELQIDKCSKSVVCWRLAGWLTSSVPACRLGRAHSPELIARIFLIVSLREHCCSCRSFVGTFPLP